MTISKIDDKIYKFNFTASTLEEFVEEKEEEMINLMINTDTYVGKAVIAVQTDAVMFNFSVDEMLSLMTNPDAIRIVGEYSSNPDKIADIRSKYIYVEVFNFDKFVESYKKIIPKNLTETQKLDPEQEKFLVPLTEEYFNDENNYAQNPKIFFHLDDAIAYVRNLI